MAFLSFFLLDVAYEIIYYSTQPVYFDFSHFDLHKLPQAVWFSIFEGVCDIAVFTVLAFIGGMVRVKFIDKTSEKFDDSIQH